MVLNRDKIRAIIMLLAFAMPITAQPQKERSSFSPDHFTLQYAGNIGLVSGGIGWNTFGDKHSSTLLLGYAPKFIAGANIITFSQKNTFNFRNFKPKKLNKIHLITGFSINVETGNNSFLKLPDKYPDNYYSTSAFTFGLFSGLVYQGKAYYGKWIKQIEYYAEIGTLAQYIYFNIKREKYFNPEILSLDLGINIKI